MFLNLYSFLSFLDFYFFHFETVKKKYIYMSISFLILILFTAIEESEFQEPLHGLKEIMS